MTLRQRLILHTGQHRGDSDSASDRFGGEMTVARLGRAGQHLNHPHLGRGLQQGAKLLPQTVQGRRRLDAGPVSGRGEGAAQRPWRDRVDLWFAHIRPTFGTRFAPAARLPLQQAGLWHHHAVLTLAPFDIIGIRPGSRLPLVQVRRSRRCAAPKSAHRIPGACWACGAPMNDQVPPPPNRCRPIPAGCTVQAVIPAHRGQ